MFKVAYFQDMKVRPLLCVDSPWPTAAHTFFGFIYSLKKVEKLGIAQKHYIPSWAMSCNFIWKYH